MTCKINADTSDGLKIVSDTSGAIDFQKAGSTQVVIDTNGNIGAGTTSPTHLADAYTTIEAKGTDTNGSGVVLATSNAGIQTQIISSDASGIGTVGTRTDHPCTFTVNNAEKMRIDSGGRVYINGTTSVATSQTSWRWDISGINYQSRTTSGTIQQFRRAGSAVGSISVATSSTAYNTSSDYRLKENVTYTWDATTRLKQLKPARFNFIADDTDTLVDGFIAHEVSSIVPEAITGTKDAVDEDGNPDYQGIDQSKLVPLLVKTIQELEARITALES